MPATNNGIAAYQRALRELREMFRPEFDRVLTHYNTIARQDMRNLSQDPNCQRQLNTTPYNAAIAYLRDERHRAEFDELRAAIRAEMDGEVDAAIESIKREFAVPEPEPATDCEGCRDKPYLDHISDEEHVRNDYDPTHGRIDRDIQEYVDGMSPSSVGTRVAIENTLQDKRDRGETVLGVVPERAEGLHPEEICPCSDPGSTHPYTLHDEVKASQKRVADSSMIPIESYSMALDEIYLLRAILADEARILDGHLNFKAFPTSRRKMAAAQVDRMRGMAAGLFEEWAREDFDPKEALRSAGVDECMTRSQWEQQRKLGESA